MDYAHKLKISLDNSRSPIHICEWLTDQMIRVYQCSEDRNCLHFIQGVTSTWALLQVLKIYWKHTDYRHLNDVLCYLKGVASI